MFKNFIPLTLIAILVACTTAKQSAENSKVASEQHRPQIHFTPPSGWMNDPNGMVYSNGTYHLFYQHYPDSTVWGPMHWGHATSTNLVEWQHKPIALYPDSLGYIFSGSAVVDTRNTSGLGKNGKAPLVAIFTYHDTTGERKGRNDFQSQAIAFSNDDGKTWTKYAGNPVLANAGIRDFRDPKVGWNEATKKWIMTLAVQDRVAFYSSPDLKNWTKESEFGKEVGAHGGVWECPDLFMLEHGGQQHWVLIVNLNPGGPNGGSATQYFVGKFDGQHFTPYSNETQWLDYGPDEYAGITWSNTGKRKIFLGWMSNWQYANLVPTKTWRSATTVPRELRLEQVGGKYRIASLPVAELQVLAIQTMQGQQQGVLNGPVRMNLTTQSLDAFSITLKNKVGQKVVLGYDAATNSFYMDRRASGKISFEPGFAAIHRAPRFSATPNIKLTLIVDKASVELFADDGLTVMTQIFFPDNDYESYSIDVKDSSAIQSFQVTPYRSMYLQGQNHKALK
ncbi:fructan beta-fructosidase [Cnuella takakiae]|uniref:Fructan beta-fructosidase n=2 Tax=Cnuella takakiae TaxID=1302690 RepID=A0A1M4SUQ5_9BACT|nr:glycosyl hydrolase family 32 [Cnuella takakiae]SHE35946.1 fructan beta-fructosidase [Cnuella takakiae]